VVITKVAYSGWPVMPCPIQRSHKTVHGNRSWRSSRQN